jgi:hypothetical protein
MPTRASRLTIAIAFPPMGTVKGLTATMSPFWSRNVPHGGRKVGGGFVFGTGPGCGPKVQKGATTRGPASSKLKPRRGRRAAREEALADGQARSGSSITPLSLRSAG